MKNTTLGFVPAKLLRNPVYVAAVNIMDRSRDSWPDYQKMMMDCLDRSVKVRPDKTSESVRSPGGDDVFHQYVDVFTRLRCPKLFPVGSMTMMTSDDPFFDRYDPSAMNAFYHLMDGDFSDEKICAILASFIPVPYDTCEYSRLTNKAVEYLVSLGRPSRDVIRSFYAELEAKCSMCPNGNYEGMLYFTLGGKENVVVYGVRNSVFYAMRLYRGAERCDFTRDYVESPHGNEERSVYTTDLDDDTECFDMRAFLANLWAARTTATFSVGREPAEYRAAMAAVTGSARPDFSAYNYVHITPEGERAYDEAREVIARAKGDCEYRKSVWFRRSYYAALGPQKKVTLCKASICHRRCAPVTGDAKPTMYT